MDITVRLSEKIVHRDPQGLYQTKEIGFELSEHDVPDDKVKEQAKALRFQVKKLIVNTKFTEGLITAEQGVDELAKYVEVTSGK